VSFFLFHQPDNTDLSPIGWATFQAGLEDEILLNPDLHDELVNNM
jgi:hypothetical protein